DAARWLDSEDATMRQVLAWAMDHDSQVALRLAIAVGLWGFQRRPQAGLYPLLREVTGYAEPGSEWWCHAQRGAGWAAIWSSDMAGALYLFSPLPEAARP